MASIGGNLLQRTRCLYFRDVATPCNKRTPGSGCPAIEGMNRMNAVLGTSAHCIAAYPGDLAVALLALDAQVELAGLHGSRSIPVGELHRAPGDTPDVETTLEPGEIITAVAIPASSYAARSHFLKVRDRASFEFALASAAVAMHVVDGVITEARVAVGGVATRPWRLPEVEEVLLGQALTPERLQRASRQAGRGAKAYRYNAYKIELMRRVVERALSELGVQT
jgi:xanthine dehydrogenase YagS FAD-binding subunit